MENQHITIAIDGPSGAGKSSLARAAAERFGIAYVDTGAIYRTVGLAVKRGGADPAKETDVAGLLPGLDIRVTHDGAGAQRMLLEGEDVSDEIRLPEVSIYTSKVSAMPAVRAFLLETQRAFARGGSVVMDGRDIGTVVLPDAKLKIFLTASPEDRARRRLEELRSGGVQADYGEVLRDIIRRDETDTRRAYAPLRAAEDAVVVDTTGNTVERSRELIFELIALRFPGLPGGKGGQKKSQLP